MTTEVLDALYAGLLKEYWGDSLAADDFYKWTWARIPHFFNTPYYVYQYATCFASSAQLYDAMTTGPAQERKAATDRYLTLLKSGGNDHPMAQLQKAGVDLTQRATIQAVVDQMDRWSRRWRPRPPGSTDGAARGMRATRQRCAPRAVQYRPTSRWTSSPCLFE